MENPERLEQLYFCECAHVQASDTKTIVMHADCNSKYTSLTWLQITWTKGDTNDNII